MRAIVVVVLVAVASAVPGGAGSGPATPPAPAGCAVWAADPGGAVLVLTGEWGHHVSAPFELPAGNVVLAWSWGPDDGAGVRFGVNLFALPGEFWLDGATSDRPESGATAATLPRAGAYALEVSSPGPWRVEVHRG